MGQFSRLKLISQLIAAGRRTQNVIFRAVGPDREGDGPALNDLFVKKFQCGPWFQSDLFQNGFSLAFQFGVNTAFGYCAHVPNVAQSCPLVKQPDVLPNV
ncbi:hypothetical protein SBV1_570011 [Verrucomicrobia bacterium]|nr:hypothetical protein SBV1_570011 [Verrucomicrobiota bacterium]